MPRSSLPARQESPPVDPHTVAWHRLWARRGRPESWNLEELTLELTLQ